MRTGPLGLALFSCLAAACLSDFALAAVKAPINVLYISRGGLWHQFMDQDPAISTFWIPVPGHSHIELLGQDPAVLQRIMRIYMPRRLEDLLARYTMVILEECPYASTAYDSIWFEDDWVRMFVEGIEAHGLSFEMWGGDASYGGGGEGFYLSWGDTFLGPLLPVECLGGYNYEVATPQKVEFTDTDSPLARLPWGSCPPVELNNKVRLRPGAHQVAEVVYGEARWPYIFDWRWGEGFVVGETQVVHSRSTLNLMINNWEYFPDFVTYLAYYGAGREIPLDIMLVKRVRSQIQGHYAGRSTVLSVLEFAEMFGADVTRAYAQVSRIDEAHSESEELFILEDYDACSLALESVEDMWRQLSTGAIRLKDRALRWVYLVEYLSISAIAMVSAFCLWTLMVRRKLYRETAATKLARST